MLLNGTLPLCAVLGGDSEAHGEQILVLLLNHKRTPTQTAPKVDAVRHGGWLSSILR